MILYLASFRKNKGKGSVWKSSISDDRRFPDLKKKLKRILETSESTTNSPKLIFKMSVFSLSESVFEQQFFESLATLAEQVEDSPKRYQITTADDEDFVVEAANPSDLWQQIHERDPEQTLGFFENVDQAAEFANMSDFVQWYTNRFVEQGTDEIAVHEIGDDEIEYFDEPEEEQEQEEDAEEEEQEEA